MLSRQIRNVARKDAVDERVDHQKNPVIRGLLTCECRAKIAVGEERADFVFQQFLERYSQTGDWARPAANHGLSEPFRLATQFCGDTFRLGIENEPKQRIDRSIEQDAAVAGGPGLPAAVVKKLQQRM